VIRATTAVRPPAALARTAGAAPVSWSAMMDGVNQSQGGNVAKEVRFNPPMWAHTNLTMIGAALENFETKSFP
jgi:hypothetical protein